MQTPPERVSNQPTNQIIDIFYEKLEKNEEKNISEASCLFEAKPFDFVIFIAKEETEGEQLCRDSILSFSETRTIVFDTADSTRLSIQNFCDMILLQSLLGTTSKWNSFSEWNEKDISKCDLKKKIDSNSWIQLIAQKIIRF